MTNETQQSHATDAKHPPIPFGTRLKTAREALGLERRDAASQLRLNEKVIIMMEKDRYPSDLPVTFIRGYIRAYGKLLQIPEYEIKKAIEPIKQKQQPSDQIIMTKTTIPPNTGNYVMQVLTYLIILTLIGLVGAWWYTHGSFPNSNPTMTGTSPQENIQEASPQTLGIMSENRPQTIVEPTPLPLQQPQLTETPPPLAAPVMPKAQEPTIANAELGPVTQNNIQHTEPGTTALQSKPNLTARQNDSAANIPDDFDDDIDMD